ncbi:F-type H+-transporting ATPase subunit epsilon [Constrictibacter sp. MBR-5]|jgi:F-type H+-transporting ATPase subunit epsilon|uniref:F0F1 ATP synthase subunit epsilon n=1 Tax=Constrictibacter sp. MBR-5 TaxID=3156467 RepID=UPI00339A223A
MTEGKVDFELVSPERLLVSQPVDMVVVPGGDGDFGVLPGHAPLISTVRSGVIEIYEGSAITDRIFVAGGFAEVTAERCTVLAELAMPVAEIDAARTEQQLREAREAESQAKNDEERGAAERLARLAEAKLEAVRRVAVH